MTRLRTIIANNKRFLDLYTESELYEFRAQKENLNDQVIQLSDNLFAYKKYLLPINDFNACVFYYKYRLNEMKTTAHVKGKTIIDAGGYIGDSALLFEELEPEKICIFEASPDTYKLLKRTIEINGLKNAVAENLALGSERGECSLYVGEHARTTGILKRSNIPYQKEIKVPVVTLDDYVEERKIENVGLIKVDIEGAESLFIKGARKTICAQKPILLLSIYHNPHDFFDIKPLIESWDLGYKFKIYKTPARSVYGDTLLIAEII